MNKKCNADCKYLVYNHLQDLINLYWCIDVHEFKVRSELHLKFLVITKNAQLYACVIGLQSKITAAIFT